MKSYKEFVAEATAPKGSHMDAAKAAHAVAQNHPSSSPEHHAAMAEHYSHLAKHHKAEQSALKQNAKDHKQHDDLVHHLKTHHKVSFGSTHNSTHEKHAGNAEVGPEKVHAIKHHLTKSGYKHHEGAMEDTYVKGNTHVSIANHRGVELRRSQNYGNHSIDVSTRKRD